MVRRNNVLVGLAGNPNVGKTTLFNALTGSKQHVGNWPGKTVEKKEGTFTYGDVQCVLVDLPGTYSLTAYTEEEAVTSDFILDENPDVIIHIVDAGNLERNLFITVQLLELGAPVVLALNMVSQAQSEGITINQKLLSELLNIPVVMIDAKRQGGFKKLLDETNTVAKLHKKPDLKLTYGREVNRTLKRIKDFLIDHDTFTEQEQEWLAIKLLEDDVRSKKIIRQKDYARDLERLVRENVVQLENIYGKDIHALLASTRFAFIRGLTREVVHERKDKNVSFSDTVDRYLTNKFLGVPLFLGVIFLIFEATFYLSNPIIRFFESTIAFFGHSLALVLVKYGAPAWVESLLIDGVVGGVGSIVAFVPIIGVLFFFMAFLEDSGYMARVAYVMDKFMHAFGLHGKAFIPFVLGFGCNVPGIMATRTLQTKKDRLLTMLVIPFVTCGARLPVYMLFVGVFFPEHRGVVIFSIYLTSIIISMLSGLVLKKILGNSLASPFVIELPRYRVPSIKGMLIHAWERVWIFIKKAGTIILVFSMIIWFLASFPFGVEYGSEQSLVGAIGKTVAPLLAPLGFGHWRAAVALMFGFVAKEVIVSTFGTLYGIDMTVVSNSVTSIAHSFQTDFTPLSAYSFMLFVLLYVPCIAVVAVIKRETHSYKWPLFLIVYTTAIAWSVSFMVFQIGSLLGF
ncbi:ferrous iron transport protein B [Patescibacteria group bacterium]|nr:ferrous iron transport protein B [Patescibacteria group bacterium]